MSADARTTVGPEVRDCARCTRALVFSDFSQSLHGLGTWRGNHPRMTSIEPKPTLVVIEDEPDIANVLEYNLRSAGFAVVVAHTGVDGLEAIRMHRPELVLLDVMLPDVEGTQICRLLRADPATEHVAIVMVTAKSEEVDRIVGFELGADEYIPKPFSVREVVLRVRAVLRRKKTPPSQTTLRIGTVELDIETHRVLVEGAPVVLTALEMRLLHTLMLRADRVQSRDILLQDVWGLETNVESRTIDTHVKRVREKLGNAGAHIETIRGVGYRFAVAPHAK